jgi:hypothetical protein
LIETYQRTITILDHVAGVGKDLPKKVQYLAKLAYEWLIMAELFKN